MNETEAAYRRGYHQAVHALRRDLLADLSPKMAKQLAAYEAYLLKWRLRQYRRDRFEVPFEFNEWLESKRRAG